MLTTAALAEKRRRRPYSFPEFDRALRPGASVGRRVRMMTNAARRATQTADSGLHAVRAAAAGLYGRIASETGVPPKVQPAARAVSPSEETTVSNEGGFLKKRLDPYLDPADGERTPVPESERTTSPPSAVHDRSLADDELEVLRAKLGKRDVPRDKRRIDEIETLKAKLGGESATRKVASLKAKLENTAEPATDSSAASLVKMRKVAMHNRQKANAVGPALAARRSPAPPTSPRSTAPRSRREPTFRTAAVSLEWPLPLKCRIAWSRGYGDSVFSAIARIAADDEQVIAESPHFRWHKAEPPPPTPEALEAHRFLLEVLERDGWSVAGTGDDWFAHELERRQADDLLQASVSERR